MRLKSNHEKAGNEPLTSYLAVRRGHSGRRVRIFSEARSYRYEMAVTVETPEGLRTGNSVIEVSSREEFSLNGKIVLGKLRGEAVKIELPNGRAVFALLKGINDVDGGYAAAAILPRLPLSTRDNADWRVVADAIKSYPAIAEVPPENEPMFVYFNNLSDPGSIVIVKAKEFSQVFGPGYHIKAVSIRIVDKPITRRLGNSLPWIKRSPENAALKAGLSLKDQSELSRLQIRDLSRN